MQRTVGGAVVSIALLATLVVLGPVTGTAVASPEVAATPSPLVTNDTTAESGGSAATNGSGSVTPLADDGPYSHGPPDAPVPPDRIAGRSEVTDTDELPHAAIGYVQLAEDGEFSPEGPAATGVLISNYHVLTAAHVPTTRDGELVDEQIRFVPGFRNPPGSEPTLPYGTARVTSVEVHPGWDGLNADGDLALLTLDRPVGREAGHLALGGWTGDPSTFDLRHAGYLGNVTGTRLLSSEPTLLEANASVDEPDAGPREARFLTCGTMGEGDSGSPIWRTVDGTPTVLGIHSWGYDDHADCEIHGNGHAKLTGANVELLREWMREDPAPSERARLRIGGPADWIRPDPEVQPASVGQPLDLSTTVYNDGGVAVEEPIDVAFEVETGEGYRRVCADEVTVGAYENATVECTVEALPPIRTGSLADVRTSVTAAPSGSRNATPDVGRVDGQVVGYLSVQPEVRVAQLAVDRTVSPGSQFVANATLGLVATSSATYDSVVTIRAERADCSPRSRSVALSAFGEEAVANVSFTCTASNRSAGNGTDLTVSTDSHSATTRVRIDDSGRQAPSYRVERLETAGDGSVAVGQEARYVATVANDGRAGNQTVSLAVAGERVAARDVRLGSEERASVVFRYVHPPADAGNRTVTVRTPQDSRSRTVTVANATTRGRIAEVRGTVTHATERTELAVDAVLSARSSGGPRQVEVAVDGRIAVGRTVDLERGQNASLTVAAPVRDPTGDAVSVALLVGGEAVATRTLPVAPPLNESFGGNAPRPHGEDGRYRDFDGNGELGHADVVAFFGVQHRPSVKAHPEYFDFNGNGLVGHGDVVSLFQRVASHPL